MHPLEHSLHALADPARAQASLRFFKSGPGEYAEGDRFLGVAVPAIRRTLRPLHRELDISDVAELLQSPWHEVRLAAAIAAGVVYRNREHEREDLLGLILANLDQLNNWDLIDTCAPHTWGLHLIQHPEQGAVNHDLIAQKSLWARRFALVSTLTPIKHAQTDLIYSLVPRVLKDPEDLIHKAAGWMLREAEPSDPQRFLAFLDEHGSVLPRTTLRYAIEKFPTPLRRQILAQTRLEPPRKG